MEKIQDKALTASAWIWQSHRVTTIWQSLVVSSDTAGALWVSGNDTSAPKPWLNPESSSDEGFVRSNAIIFYIGITSDPSESELKNTLTHMHSMNL